MILSEQQREFNRLIEANYSINGIRNRLNIKYSEYKLFYKIYIEYNEFIKNQKIEILEKNKKRLRDMWRRVEEYIWMFHNAKKPIPIHIEHEFKNLIEEYASLNIYQHTDI